MAITPVSGLFKANASLTPPDTSTLVSAGYPTSGDAKKGTQPTSPGAAWYYLIDQMRLSVMKAAGMDEEVPPSPETFLEALKSLGWLDDGQIATEKLADLAITTAKLANLSVTAAKLAASSVETSKIKDLAVTTAKLASGAVTSDKLASGAGLANLLPNTAPAHNSIYRGKDLTSIYSISQLSAKVQAGDFSDLFIGDYITKAVTVNGTTYNVNWLFADFDYQLGNGDTECTQHHIVMIPNICLGNAQMNSSNVIDGGYQGSAMWKTTIPLIATGLKNAFGSSHVLSFRTLLSNAASTTASSMAGAGRVGCSTDWSWVDCLCNLMSERQLYGGAVHGSSFYDVGERKSQFSIFRLHSKAMNIRADYWLSAVGASDGFCYCGGDGYAFAYNASISFGVRPYFLFH